MLPVSGAEQLNTSADHMIRPISSAHKRIFEVGELRALELEALVDMAQRLAGRHEQVPQARLFGLGLQLLDHLDRLPPVPLGDLGLIVLVARPDVSLDELAHPVPVKSLPFRKVEVHPAGFLAGAASLAARKRGFAPVGPISERPCAGGRYGPVPSVSPNFLLLTRIGFAARGLLYLIVGYLALKLGRAEDAGGALDWLQNKAGGLVLGALALGFVAYGVWRVTDAVFDTQSKGRELKGIAGRLAGAVSGLIHLGLAFTAAKLALGGPGRRFRATARRAARRPR